MIGCHRFRVTLLFPLLPDLADVVSPMSTCIYLVGQEAVDSQAQSNVQVSKLRCCKARPTSMRHFDSGVAL